ncbi:response regulator transcription factor [Nocardia pneumoniae]|uniref:response regulator transcription factor n=1 Tax=Nocardia pneumoniae TaxID=228601 RepID=UPI0002D3433A|nr:response regulator transcription factor [Nocardia pneumoniae]
MLTKSLSRLGLTAVQERVYRYLLRNPHVDPATAADQLALPDLPEILAQLRALGLVNGSHTAVTPAVAVDLLVRHRIDGMRREFAVLTSAWDVLEELSEEHRSRRSIRLIEHIPDRREAARRIRAILADEAGEIVSARPHTHRPDVLSLPVRTPRWQASGLRSRTIVSAPAPADPELRSYARRRNALGDLHRVTSEPVKLLTVINRAVAFVQADPTEPQGGLLQLGQPGVAAVLADFFDGMWSRASDLDDLPLLPIEQHVLHALTAYDTDETAARSLNISVRKFRAHIADLMARLGARTRFQAALRARDLGWL